ncbi:hypothetical protein WJ13_20605 [Burkholderia seminalis]|nr:hypothetical protein WJ13_20605 [Burkholderia seminalis]
MNFPERIREFQSSRFFGIVGALEIPDQALFHAKHGVLGEIATIRCENVSDDRLKAWRLDDEMYVSGTVGVPAEGSEHLSDGAIIGHWIKPRFDRPQPKVTISVGLKFATEVSVGLDSFLLYVVKPVVIGLPHIDHCTSDRVTVDIGDPGPHNKGFAFMVATNIGAVRRYRNTVHEERSQDRVFGRASRTAMIDGIYKHRDAEYIRQQNELLPPFCTHMPCIGQEMDGRQPFFVRRFDFLDRGMKMPNDCFGDDSRSRGYVRANSRVDYFC